MKTVVRQTSAFRSALEAFLQKHPNIRRSVSDLNPLFKETVPLGDAIGSDQYKVGFTVEEITITTRARDKVVTTSFDIVSRVRSTVKQTTVTLLDISESAP